MMANSLVDRYSSGCSWNLRFFAAIFLADGAVVRFNLHPPSMPPYRFWPTDGDEDDNANVFVFMARRVYTSGPYGGGRGTVGNARNTGASSGGLGLGGFFGYFALTPSVCTY